MPLLSKIVIIVRYSTVPFRLDNFWTLKIGIWQQDGKLGDFWVNRENLGQLEDIWIFQFQISTVVIF